MTHASLVWSINEENQELVFLVLNRVSCVMLNKGKHVVEAVSTLDKILHPKATRMRADLKPILLCSHLL